MDRDCANCDYSGGSLGGRCCWDSDNEPETSKVITTLSTQYPPAERLYTQSEVKVMIDVAVEQYVRKCDECKNEMLQMMRRAKRQEGE